MATKLAVLRLGWSRLCSEISSGGSSVQCCVIIGSTLIGDSLLVELRTSRLLTLDRLEMFEMLTNEFTPGSDFRFSSKGVISSSRLSRPFRELEKGGSLFTGGRIPRPENMMAIRDGTFIRHPATQWYFL